MSIAFFFYTEDFIFSPKISLKYLLCIIEVEGYFF